jgi:hypothetical protein
MVSPPDEMLRARNAFLFYVAGGAREGRGSGDSYDGASAGAVMS